MNYFSKIVTVYVLMMMAVLILFVRYNSKFVYNGRDIIYYNDQLHSIEKEYGEGQDEQALEDKYGCQIVLSKEVNNEELAYLYSKNAFVLDLAPNGDYIGKVAWLDMQENFNEARNSFFMAAVMLWAAVFAGGCLTFIIFYFSFIKPVSAMKSFSEQIAKGNLDDTIPMHKNNLFGGILEALDIMREELKISRQKEIEAEVARKEMVTQLSHDIKTPVAIIKATCEVMELKSRRRLDIINSDGAGAVNSEEVKELTDNIEKVETITRKSHTITEIVNNMIHATLEELDKIEINVQEENATLIEDYFKSLKDYGNIILKNNINPCLIYMDRLRMEQVIDNVVGNSYKYAGTDIEVSFDEISDVLMSEGSKGAFIKIKIKDSGEGVSEDDLPLLAEKYYRGANAKEGNGYGLGMYLVKNYMDKQGGGMEYYNDNGFVVELLLKKV